ncbi:hypothetical protein GSI_09702 [Ganoderma sinense ZZ0214-1]|uniref:Uncharacterized protein n=1 Tax=Ganoderma sinense ZZ0214-1 TaxID=1077348 RepID=A0A2G8S317_9APHY|nr:hypothetical protein GSI_09702 [Ganoderma sinense ZZ0214-1]
MAPADEETTPRAHRWLSTGASYGQQSANDMEPHDLTLVAESQVKRRREYAEQLQPLSDQDLPSALRGNPAYLLHYGFECALPRYQGDPSVKDAFSRSQANVRSMTKKIANVNKALTGNSEVEVMPPLRQAFTITDAARPRDIFVLGLYSSDTPNPPHYSEADIERILEELRKEFGAVERPMWYWSERRHGADTHNFQPFDEVYPRHPVTANP